MGGGKKQIKQLSATQKCETAAVWKLIGHVHVKLELCSTLRHTVYAIWLDKTITPSPEKNHDNIALSFIYSVALLNLEFTTLTIVSYRDKNVLAMARIFPLC